jgi:PmbA protein
MHMEIAKLAVKKAVKLGASEAEAYVHRARTIQIGFAEQVQDVRTVESSGLGLRVCFGRKAAMYSTSVLSEDDVGRAVERVIKVAEVTPEDPDWNHLNRRYGRSSVKGYFDKEIETIDHYEIMERLEPAIKIMNERDKRVKPTRGMLTLVSSNVSVANNYGEAMEDRSTLGTAWIGVKAEDAGLEATGSEHLEVRTWEEIDLESMSVSAVDKAVGYLKARPIAGGEMPVIIRNQVAASILGVMLSTPINADVVQKGGSPLVNKVGEQVASDPISINVDCTIEMGFGTRPFDDEGHPTNRTPVIDKGVLKGFLYDNYTALKDDIDSTGNAMRRGYFTPPTPAPTNLILGKGKADHDDIIQDTKNGLYVDNVIGEWLSNPVSGNLNATVTHGHIIKNGELQEPVKGVVLAGNFFELLKEGFEVVGGDTRNTGGYYSPTVKFNKLTIAGE